MKTFKFWFNNSRPVSLPQSMIPALTAIFLCAWNENFSIWLGIISLIGVMFAHLSMNLIDDYFDYRKMESGYRDALVREGIRARTLKCAYLVSGEATLKQLRIAIVLFALPAILAGIVVLVLRGYPILIIAGITIILGISYSGNPLKLSYRGFGELVIGIIFGPLIVIGMGLASAGTINGMLIVTGITMGLLVTNILFTHSVMDYEADLRASKATLAILVKKDSLKLFFSSLFIFLPYIVFILGWALGYYSPIYLVVLLTVFWSVALFKSIIAHVIKKETDIVRKKMVWPYEVLGTDM